MRRAYYHFAGREVDTASEEWRHETEVAYVLAMNPDERKAFIDGVPNSGLRGVIAMRGQAAADRLLDDVRRLAEIRRERAN
ncbi:MAG TPA: hypothetical protein VIL65_13805 [Beijerinckiaceae bacterium]|jgi:hypothetical protein